MYKVELHTHINEDPKDNIKYSVYDLIKDAKKKNFDVIAITMHNKLFNNKKAIAYAKKRGILLIPGIEKSIEGKDTLVYNPPFYIEKIKTLKELALMKQQYSEMFVIAPHPYYFFPVCHKNNILRHLDLFDAWEFSYMHLAFFNPNSKILKLAKKHNKPVVGNSDVHRLKDLGKTYTMIDADNLSSDAIFDAIKNKKLKVLSRPLRFNDALSRFIFN
jgi:predicted metal-dependent phosphoesterase TrpH